ncbi:hypothetical protein E1B28_004711 [Marasmius oreades]|uniref:Vacuolar membrane protein n=1 Tax=Marasmius oreades TaxID=181124 RepID=A0A9P8AD35_9AGAR|nr:uncharacterized protein E1B28_004711 [Marasmius oreades]XP_043013831.1 uncharacterized protein E1B28_004711 [Marasmius oreades]KAG7097360.1 hypothetical protein E1B28_004711 [Marasmius oreades]KAG7097361.1 hypothetical protein E1B28_004711 [Marasmius oreades]
MAETGKPGSEVLWNDKKDPSLLEVDNRSCQLLGPTALAVQGLMGILVILSLIYKRHREVHKRPWKIWIFDVSKQIVGQMFVHGVNVLISGIISHYGSSNACVSYFLNILIDTTLGVLILYGIHHGLTHIITEKLHLQGFQSGVYGKPPSIMFWARQAAVYVFSLTTMKFAVIGLLALFPGLYKIGEWLLSWTWTEEGDDLQVIFTMGIFPIIMNILQFWIIDSIVKASDAPVALAGDSPTAQDHADREPLFGMPSDDEDEDDHVTQRRPHDIENPPISRSSEPKAHSRIPTSEGDESKDPCSNTRGNSLEFHSYPPSLSNSAGSFSSNSSMGASVREATKLNKKKKRPPSPLNLQPQYQPAINSPHVAVGTPHRSPLSTSTGIPELAAAPQAADNEWADSWEDSDDWAGRVGEEEWTGRRLGQTNANLHNAWGTSTVAVS